MKVDAELRQGGRSQKDDKAGEKLNQRLHRPTPCRPEWPARIMRRISASGNGLRMDVISSRRLPRREREIFETLCRLEEATTAGVRAALTDPLSDSAIRTLLSRLEGKGPVAREPGAAGFVYRPVPRASK